MLRNKVVSTLPKSTIPTASSENNKKEAIPPSDAGPRKRSKLSSGSSLDNNIFAKNKKTTAQDDDNAEIELNISLAEPSCDVMLCTHLQLHESCTLLTDYDPSYVVFYDPDIEIIRSIEVFQSSKAQRIKVYFLMHGNYFFCNLVIFFYRY